MFNLLFENPLLFVIIAVTLILSLTIHEFSHAFVAMKLGDYTGKYMGRVTLNPMAHLDPVGTLLLLFVGFGWGKPVPFDPYNLKNPKRDSALISVAGPASNLLIAVFFILFIRFLPISTVISSVLSLVIYYNLILCFFNLLPFHPLDGFKVVYGLLPINLAIQWHETEKYGIYILFILILTRSTGFLITPAINFTLSLFGINF